MPLAGLQRYQIMESLGAGAQGQTFRAIDRETGTAVAVKVLRLRNLGSDWKPYDLFERECQVLRDLNHPAIPHYLDQFASEATGEFFLVMQLIDGEPLSRRFGRAGLPEPELRALLLQALDILEYLHDRQPPVIHRDIKPSNLIVRPNHASPLALIDFGGVRLALNPEGGSTMIGTFGYMAPEQLHGEATPATDIYALGATLAALAAGTPADRLPRKGLAIDLPAVLPPSPLRDVLAAMLAPDPGQRLQRAADVRRLLARAAPDPKDRSRTPGPPGQPRPPPRDLAPAPPRDLAPPSRLPRPLQFIVWIWSLMAGGLFFVVEHIFIPMAFALAGLHPRYTKARRRKRLAARQTAALYAVRGVRHRIEVIGRRHDPNRQSLPAADDDD
jgi:serine/threonine protein kinase